MDLTAAKDSEIDHLLQRLLPGRVYVKDRGYACFMMETPAEVVGLIFRKRWTVELFFRFFKHLLGCRHLLSHRTNGIEIQVYMAIIVCMLIALWTGGKPTRRTLEMIRFYFTGWASLEELEAHIASLKKQAP